MGPSGPVVFHLSWLPPTDLQAFVLSSVELQVLTGSCFKLGTVHNIPVTSNKDGKIWNPRLLSSGLASREVLPGPSTNTLAVTWLPVADLCSAGLGRLSCQIHRSLNRCFSLLSPWMAWLLLWRPLWLKRESGVLVHWDCDVNMFLEAEGLSLGQGGGGAQG